MTVKFNLSGYDSMSQSMPLPLLSSPDLKLYVGKDEKGLYVELEIIKSKDNDDTDTKETD